MKIGQNWSNRDRDILTCSSQYCMCPAPKTPAFWLDHSKAGGSPTEPKNLPLSPWKLIKEWWSCTTGQWSLSHPIALSKWIGTTVFPLVTPLPPPLNIRDVPISFFPPDSDSWICVSASTEYQSDTIALKTKKEQLYITIPVWVWNHCCYCMAWLMLKTFVKHGQVCHRTLFYYLVWHFANGQRYTFYCKSSRLCLSNSSCQWPHSKMFCVGYCKV